MSSEAPASLCGMCLGTMAKYTCPRCNLKYCSRTCYNDAKHGACSESFYQESVMAELYGNKVGDAERSSMKEMLLRLGRADTEEDEQESDPELELAERLENIDLEHANVDEILSKLTSTERNGFEQFLKLPHLDLSVLLPIWTPWWTIHHIKPMIQDITDDTLKQTTSDQNESRPPVLLDNIPPLTREPSKDLCFNVVEILFVYAAVARFFNGEHIQHAHDASRMFLILSSTLSSTEPFAYESSEEASAAFVQCATENAQFFNSLDHLPLLVTDVIRLLEQDKLLLAMCDIHCIFNTALHTATPYEQVMTNRSSATLAVQRRSVARVERKTLFYVSFVHDLLNAGDHGDLLLETMQISLRGEGERIMLRSRQQETVRSHALSKPLIEPLPTYSREV